MKYNLIDNGGEFKVELNGGIDFSCNEDFESMLDVIKARKPRRVVFDLGAVTSLDSVGLGLLFIAREEFNDVQCPFALSRASGSVARLLALTNAKMSFVMDDN